MIIMAISTIYTWFLTNKLKEGEEKSVLLYAKAIEDLSKFNPEDNHDLTLQTQMTLDFKIPSILVDRDGHILSGYNFGDALDTNQVFLEKELAKIKKSKLLPVEVQYLNQFVYYKHSNLYTLLTYFPYFQFLLVSLFIGLGYLGISMARKDEQERLWVGMAKETAHQLGTPISAIMGWLEHLKIMNEEHPDQMEIIDELSNDVHKLERVADRFSKIGSTPVLSPTNIYIVMDRTYDYMIKRVPQRVKLDFPLSTENEPIYININAPLFDWVLENLIRNALDAMAGQGFITCRVYEDEMFVSIELEDTGKGMTPKQAHKVFQPGFTTKTRGWGLGLSLSRRIIEDYHGGKNSVKKSIVNQGTTFLIRLPRS